MKPLRDPKPSKLGECKGSRIPSIVLFLPFFPQSREIKSEMNGGYKELKTIRREITGTSLWIERERERNLDRG